MKKKKIQKKNFFSSQLNIAIGDILYESNESLVPFERYMSISKIQKSQKISKNILPIIADYSYTSCRGIQLKKSVPNKVLAIMKIEKSKFKKNFGASYLIIYEPFYGKN